MIWLPGDFSIWALLIGACVFGVTTALIIGSLIAAGLTAAGTTAYGIKSAVEGNYPWTDPGAWFTGYAQSLVSPIQAQIQAATGEDTISEQLKNLTGEISRGGGSGGELQAATGHGPAALSAESQLDRGVPPPSQPQPMGGQPGGVYEHQGHPDMAALGRQGVGSFSTPEAMEQRAVDRWSSGGAMRYDAMDAAEEPPSRKDVLGGAWKNIGIQAGIQAVAAAVPYAGAALAPAAGAAAAAAAPAITAATEIAPVVASAVPAAASIAAEVAPAVASTAASAAPSFATTALEGLKQIPSFLGDSATGILQKTLTQGLMGAGKGVLSSLASGEDPGRGALFGGATGAAGGFGGGVGGFGASAFAPAPVPTLTANPFPMPEIGAPDYVGGMAPGAPTLTSSVASMLPRAASAGASGLVGQLMQPSQPSQPAEPIYSSRPSYYDVYDIGGQNATYGGRRPYWG